MYKIFVFIMFLGPLVFFHELGHYLFARFFGVRVEVFSIGFGPKIFRWVKNGTEYVISLIPLGGYVKMFGDSLEKDEVLSEEEKKVAFNYKSKSARFWIVFGGPLANFILAFIIFFTLTFIGEKVPEFRIGSIGPNSFLAINGFNQDDTLTHINSLEIFNFLENTSDENVEIKSVTVKGKLGENRILTLNSKLKNLMDEIGKSIPNYRLPIFTDERGNYLILTQIIGELDLSNSLEELLNNPKTSIIYIYKINSLDEILNIKKMKLDTNVEIKQRFKIFDLKNEAVYPFTEVFNSKKNLLNSGNEDLSFSRNKNISEENFLKVLHQNNLFPLDLRVESIIDNSPAAKANLKVGDVIIGLNGVPIYQFDKLREEIQKLSENKSIDLEIFRLTSKQIIKLNPELSKQGDESVWRIGVMSAGKYLPPNFVHKDGMNFLKSFENGFIKTISAVKMTLIGFKKLLFQEVSIKNIGGPLAIGKVASDSLNINLSSFFKLMALISVNLGVINLFPIPILDGGHIVFLFLELVNGGPLSKKKLEMAHKVGLSFLVVLIFTSLYNDLVRFFG
jgi:regulator of sigma E protease